MSNNQNGPFGPPPGGDPEGWGQPGASGQPGGYPPPPQQQMQQGYGAPPMQQGYPGQQPMQQGYGPPMQQGYPGQQPMGYGPAPINIVVQNTANAGKMGGIVRVSNKTRMTAVVLAFFLGGLGVHKFYLGRTLLGVLYLVFCWTLIPSCIAFIEFIMLLIMSDHDFDMKYNSALAR